MSQPITRHRPIMSGSGTQLLGYREMCTSPVGAIVIPTPPPRGGGSARSVARETNSQADATREQGRTTEKIRQVRRA